MDLRKWLGIIWWVCLLSGIALAAEPSSPAGGKFSTDEKGLVINAGPVARFTLEYPKLLGSNGKVIHKLVEKRPSGADAILTYEGGAELRLQTSADGALSITFANIPADVTQYTMPMLLGNSLIDGGVWRVDAGAEQAFPAEKPAKPHLYQGHPSKFFFRNGDGREITVSLPADTFLQLTDYREWGLKKFGLVITTPLNRDQRVHQWGITLGGQTAMRLLVDTFGQDANTDFPGKVKRLEELSADVEEEKAYYASFNPPSLDAYGGLPGSGAAMGLRKTGFFHVEKKGEQWHLVNPEGNVFFHLGIGCFQGSSTYTYVKGREKAYEFLPDRNGELAAAWHPKDPDSFDFYQANVIRKYGKPIDHTELNDRMITRVQRLGFNSGGPFSSGLAMNYPSGRSFPMVAMLSMSEGAGFKQIPGIRCTWDPFDPKMRELVETRFADKLPRGANNPLVIGHFLENEPIYEDIPKVVPTLDGKWACKHKLVETLQTKYQTIDAYNAAWNAKATSFEELIDQRLAVTTRAAAEDVNAFTGLFLESYFELIATTFRKYNKNHMLIGNRLQASTINNEQLCRIMGKYLDVVSFNYYTYHVDKAFLNRIYQWTGGRPMIFSEFYFNAVKESGLPGGVKDLNTQEERGMAYRNYVEQAASTGFVVGVEWFTLIDQPRTGLWWNKYAGENGNSGLFAVTDRPWKLMVEQMARTNHRIYDVLLGKQAPFVYADPRFSQDSTGQRVMKIHRATGPIAIDGAATNFPAMPAEVISGKRLVEGSDAGSFEASYKACWDDQNLYLLVNVIDDTPMQNANPPQSLWKGDGIELFVGADSLAQGGAMLFSDRQVLLRGAAAAEMSGSYFANASAQHACETKVVANVDGTGYTLEVAIPWTALNVKPEVGVEFRFDLGVNDSATGTRRLRQLMWNGTNRNSGDRSGWGSAVLAQ